MRSIDDVRRWLRDNGFGQHESVFAQNEIDAEVLLELTDADLQSIGLTLGARKKLLKAIAALTPTEVDTPQASPPGSGPERRQLTVMLCDLVGSTAMSRVVDPEEMREINLAYQAVCSGAVERFDGFVARFMGDGVLAYFGFPQAEETDPERAVRAGLSITAELETLRRRFGSPGGYELAVRVGIATGPVVVGDVIGSGASEESSVVGETPNLASRLQAIAAPDSVVIAESTRALVGDLFRYRALGEQRLKGIDVPLHCFQVLGEVASVSRFDAVRAGRFSPLVGRDEEVGVLERRWREACEGEGHVILLSGEAGIGKSRLIEAVRKTSLRELRLQCSPHGMSTALHPIIGNLERSLDKARYADCGSALDTLESLIMADEETRPRTLSLIASLLSIPYEHRYSALALDSRQQLELTLQALLAHVLALADTEPTLVAFEDAHWIDPTSLELLSRLVEASNRHALLVIISFRPDFDAPWIGEAHVTSMRLNKLNPVSCVSLIRSVSAQAALSDEVIQEINARADGVPLFLEELTKSVLEEALSDSGSLRIPATLHDSLMSRLDRLGDAKAVAQTAAVIGREFDQELLFEVFSGREAVLVAGLDVLVDSGLIFRRGAPPNARYIFKHALVQDAAYENLLRSKRREIHARVAGALRKKGESHRLSEPERIAHHYTEADMPHEAVEYRLLAGDRAIHRSASAEAAVQFELGLAQLAKLEPSRVRDEMELQFLTSLVTALRTSAGWFNQRAIDANERARSLCESLGDAATLYRVLQQDRVKHWIRGEHAAAIRVQRAMAPIGRKLEDQRFVDLDATFVAWPMLVRGDVVDVESILEETPSSFDEDVSREYRY